MYIFVNHAWKSVWCHSEVSQTGCLITFTLLEQQLIKLNPHLIKNVWLSFILNIFGNL